MMYRVLNRLVGVVLPCMAEDPLTAGLGQSAQWACRRGDDEGSFGVSPQRCSVGVSVGYRRAYNIFHLSHLLYYIKDKRLSILIPVTGRLLENII